MADLDLLDRKILFELDLNARIPASSLAKKLRRSKDTINFRINRLFQKGYLKGTYTVCNTSKLGYYYYKVYIKFKNITPEREQELLLYISKSDNIAYLASVEGHYDCIFLIMVRSAKDMAGFMDPFVERFGNFIQEKDIAVFLTAHRLNERFLFAGKERQDLHYPVEIGNYPLDALERGILGLLSTNARMTAAELAEKLGAEHHTVSYRIKKLEHDGIVLGHATAPNFERLGLLFIQLNISLKNPRARKSVIGYFEKTDSCLFAIELLGKYDLTIELHVPHTDELRRIMDGFRVAFVHDYNDYDVLIINKEYLMVWNPFGKEAKK